MIERGNPIGIAASGAFNPETVEGQLHNMHRRIQEASRQRQSWVDKQRKLLEQRRGIRKPKNTPWPNANNDSWPITDGTIRRWKPGILSLLLDADPVAYFWAKRPDHVEAARSVQNFFHWAFHDIDRLKFTAAKLVDYVPQYGFAVTHEKWDYRLERTCRIVSSKALFPEGVEGTTQQFNAAVEQQNAQLDQAAAENPDQAAEIQQQRQQPMTPDQFVRMVLENEYNLGDVDNEQLEKAVTAILQGAEYVKIYYMAAIADKLGWEVINPLDVIFPTRTNEPETADYVAIAYRMTEDEIRRMVRDGHFDAEAGAELIEKIRSDSNKIEERWDLRAGGSDRTLDQELEQAAGVTRHGGEGNSEPGKAVVWKVYCRLDLNDDQILERAVWWYAPSHKITLSLQEYALPFEEWPVTFYYFERNSDLVYANRGAAELLHAFQKQVNKLHNARLDAIQILLAPMFTVRATSDGRINRNIKFRPGQFIPVKDEGDFKPVQMDLKPLFAFLQEENFTKSLAEQYLGVFDGNLLDKGGSERRTATEVEAITAQISSVFTLDATLFQTSFARSLEKLWKLWREFGPDETFFRVTGEDIPKLIRKADIAYDYDIQPSGTPANTNKALALARAREAIQLAATDQTGLLDRREIYKNFFELTDRNLAKRAVRDLAEAALVQQLMEAVAASGQEPAPL